MKQEDEIYYEEAIAKLKAVTAVKEAVGFVMDRLTRVERCGMWVESERYRLAISCIHEIIDDVFADETLPARRIKEAYERKDWLAYRREVLALLL